MTGAPIIQLCQMQALRASSRCTILAHSPARDAAAVAFEAELVLQRPDDRLDPLPQPSSGSTGGPSRLRGLLDQGQAQVVAGEEGLGLLSGQALVGDDGGAGRRAVSGLVLEHLPGLLAFAEELGIGQAEAGDGAVGADERTAWPPSTSASGWGTAVPAERTGQRFAVTADCPHGTGVASISGSISADPACDRHRSQCGLDQRRECLTRSLYSACRAAAGTGAAPAWPWRAASAAHRQSAARTCATARHTSQRRSPPAGGLGAGPAEAGRR